MYDESKVPSGLPRKSWQMRAWQQREAVAEGLAEWQANPYFAAGRVTVPALMDTFATQCFFNKYVTGGCFYICTSSCLCFVIIDSEGARHTWMIDFLLD